eukprot:CAMPEP_0201535988 /NCGR_PEP_ID=MMETSP0161_2-20130828/60628_1 /ASSEMBLY_ACC=CAM_ASM_000251 /TAXON_ID=180227 /ORGANISM="Neoparamoeba aestuarina, Strain SoJaBio B1-5/56/2" /LENGTH=280 /DNA_ID=CAMNT_0047941439 /DNA_START=65 /DNA_END=907 /DNA_ORIENTATION=+
MALPSSYESYSARAPLNWTERLAEVHQKVSEKRVHLTNQKQELTRILAETKKLQRDHAKAKNEYSTTVNNCAQKLHDSIIRYESARENKENLLEQQQTLNANYDKLYDKAQEMKAKQLVVEQDRKAKAHEYEQRFLTVKSQLSDVQSQGIEVKKKKEEFVESLRCIASSCNDVFHGHAIIPDGHHLLGDAARNFYENLLEKIHTFSQNIPGNDSRSRTIEEIYDEARSFHKELEEFVSTVTSQSKKQSQELHALYQQLESANMESQHIEIRLREVAQLLT